MQVHTNSQRRWYEFRPPVANMQVEVGEQATRSIAAHQKLTQSTSPATFLSDAPSFYEGRAVVLSMVSLAREAAFLSEWDSGRQGKIAIPSRSNAERDLESRRCRQPQTRRHPQTKIRTVCDVSGRPNNCCWLTHKTKEELKITLRVSHMTRWATR